MAELDYGLDLMRRYRRDLPEGVSEPTLCTSRNSLAAIGAQCSGRNAASSDDTVKLTFHTAVIAPRDFVRLSDGALLVPERRRGVETHGAPGRCDPSESGDSR